MVRVSPLGEEPTLPLWKTVLVQVLLGMVLMAALAYSHDCSGDPLLVREIQEEIRGEMERRIREHTLLSGEELAAALDQLPTPRLLSVKRRGEYLRVAIAPPGAAQLNIPRVRYYRLQYLAPGYTLRSRSNAVFYYRSLW